MASGGTAPYTYAITAGALPGGLTLNPATGAVTGTPTTAGTFNFTVTATDSTGGQAATTSSNCSIAIAPPTIAVTCITNTGTVGIPYSSAFVASGGTAPYSYAITAGALPGGLTLNPATGAVTGTPTTAGTFNFTVTATDSTGGQAATTSSNCSVVIAPPTLAVVCITSTGTVGTPYNSSFVATGGTAPYNYAITAGALPGGLTLNPATGAVTGTPTTAGTFNFTVTATDSTGGQAATKSSNCSIVIAPPTLAVVCITSTGTVGTPYNSSFVATGGTAPYNYAITAGALPGGLTLNPATGAVTGTPTTAGTFNFTVTATDSTGGQAATKSSNCSIVIAPPTLAVVCITNSGKVGVPYSSAFVASGGTAPYTFAITAGALPGGLTLNPATGAVTGTPTTAGTFNFTVTATDSTGGQAATKSSNCSIVIAPPTIAVVCITNTGIVGAPYSSSFVATGGTAPYTFAITAGALPGGLTLNPATGAVTGTPTTAGTFNFTVTATDSTGGQAATTSSNCSIVIGPRPSASCIVITAVQGVAITPVTMVGSGGAGGPYTFTATGLPTGLTMSTTGTISGTPTVSGIFNYTVTVKDKNGNTGTVNCSVTVNPPVICPPTTIDLTGNTATTGTSGNIRTFTAPNGVKVNASGWARDKSTGAWSTAYLGSYSPGLGVTDSTENGSDPTHKVDNVGAKINYVLFEFSQPVVINRAYLDSVTTDSDITVWIGTKTNPFTSHITLSDATLTSLGFTEENLTTSSTARWADINAGGVTGNVLVIAALASDTSAEDQFKISKLDIACAGATVQTPSASCVAITAIQGTAITPVSMVGSGGAGAPYTFSATGLPAGLTMSTTGTISGTPTVSGTFNYTVTVKDKNGVAGTVNCSVTVTPPVVCAPTTFDLTGNTASYRYQRQPAHLHRPQRGSSEGQCVGP